MQKYIKYGCRINNLHPKNVYVSSPFSCALFPLSINSWVSLTLGEVSVLCINQGYKCITIPWFIAGSVCLCGVQTWFTCYELIQEATPCMVAPQVVLGVTCLEVYWWPWVFAWAVMFCGRFSRFLFSEPRSKLLGGKWCFVFLLIFLSLCSNSCKAQESMLKWSNCKYHSLVTYFPLSLVKCDF